MLAFSVKPVCVNNLKSILLYILHLLDDNDLHTVFRYKSVRSCRVL